MQQQDPEAIGFEQIIGVIRRRLPLIVLCIVVVAGAAFGFSKRETKEYTATAALNFSNNSLSQEVAGISPVSSNLLAAEQASNIELVGLGNMASQTAAILRDGLTAAKVASKVSVAGHGEASVVDVSATDASPTLAAAIANTYATQFVKEQLSANHKYLKSALAIVRKQIATLTPEQRVGSDGLQLQDRVQTLSLLAELKEGNVTVAAEAIPPSSPSSPKTSRNTGIGLVLGLVLGLSLAFLLERLDRRVKDPEELESIYRLPSLGSVPKSRALASSRGPLPPDAAEAFGLIRAHLRFFNIDRDLRTVIIASASAGDGKTTIARHLAETTAKLGSHVLLLEVDLRHPTLAQQLNVQPGPGLAGVLVGAISMREATLQIELGETPGGGSDSRTLDVLAAGSVLPPNPAALLESSAMDAVLAQARSTYDLIVVDTPPLTVVSDGFPLLTKADGVVIVGWVRRSRRDAAEQLHRVLASSAAPVLGVVANGSSAIQPSIYSSPSSTAPPAGASSNGAFPPEALAPAIKT